jgi:hypothetical protein
MLLFFSRFWDCSDSVVCFCYQSEQSQNLEIQKQATLSEQFQNLEIQKHTTLSEQSQNLEIQKHATLSEQSQNLEKQKHTTLQCVMFVFFLDFGIILTVWYVFVFF